MIKVFKVCEKDEWEEVKDREFFKGSKNDQSDVHKHAANGFNIYRICYFGPYKMNYVQ